MRGIGLGELAAVTRIPRRSLERLEAGEFDAHSDGFARGFVRAVAVALGLDPDDAVTRMCVEPVPEAGVDSGLALRRAALLLVAGGLLLAVAGLGLWLVGRGEEEPPLGSEIVLRRDAVRALAAEVPESPVAGPPEPSAAAAPPEASAAGPPHAD